MVSKIHHFFLNSKSWNFWFYLNSWVVPEGNFHSFISLVTCIKKKMSISRIKVNVRKLKACYPLHRGKEGMVAWNCFYHKPFSFTCMKNSHAYAICLFTFIWMEAYVSWPPNIEESKTWNYLFFLFLSVANN